MKRNYDQMFNESNEEFQGDVFGDEMLRDNGLSDDFEETDEYDENLEDDGIIKSFDEIIYADFEKKLTECKQHDMDVDLDDEIMEVNVPLEQAVQDYQSGTREAFDYIYEQYKPKLERLGYRKNNDDLAQELSIVLLRAIETFDINGGAKFNTYYWKCARNHMGTLNIRQNAKKRRSENGVVSMQQSFNVKDSEVSFDSFVEDKDVELNFEDSTFKMMLEKDIYPYLKDNDVKAIKMLIDGYTLEDIGQQLGGITAPAVHVKFRRLPEKKIVGKQLKALYEMYCS